MNLFSSLHEYQSFVYSIRARFTSVSFSTLTLVQRGVSIVELTGELHFFSGHQLHIYERLRWRDGQLALLSYGYEVFQSEDKLYWYDSQPHPHIPELASTHPHHKHIPPDIKHNRIPAPGLSFSAPNLPFLIREIERLAESGAS